MLQSEWRSGMGIIEEIQWVEFYSQGIGWGYRLGGESEAAWFDWQPYIIWG